MIRRLLPLAAVAVLAGCGLFRHRPRPRPAPSVVSFVVGAPYQAGGVWRYPHESFSSDETGLATVTERLSGLTDDGERADPDAMAAAHPTLQLPAIARVTDLDTGLQVVVRVNDRGPERRGRVIALTPRVLALLGAAGQDAVRVRVTVLEDESRQLAAQVNAGGTPYLNIQAAPEASVATETLAPPPGVGQAPARPLPGGPAVREVAASTAAPIPLRLPELVTQVAPSPGALFVEAGTFNGLQYANLLARRLAFLGARATTSYAASRDRAYRVVIGPLYGVADADAMLDRVIDAGIGDARIVAE